MTVAELLTASRASHAQYRALGSPAKKQPQVKGDPSIIGGHLWDAYYLRAHAHKTDPQQTDPAWAEDLYANRGVSSADLQRFYRKALGIS
jgi:hypothetical protein